MQLGDFRIDAFGDGHVRGLLLHRLRQYAHLVASHARRNLELLAGLLHVERHERSDKSSQLISDD